MNYTTTTFDAAALEQRLRTVEPGIILTPPRILRRVIKKHSGVGGPGLQVPHRKTYVLRRDDLFAIADRAELDLPGDRELPEIVVLLPQPSDDQLTGRTSQTVLRKYWHLLFHARIHTVFQQRRRDGLWNEAAVRERIRRLGMTEFAEARTVLRQEHFLLPPGDDATSYEELVALYLELRYFAPEKLPRYFPSLDAATAEHVFAEDVNAEQLLAATRPEGVNTPTEQANDEFLTVRRMRPTAPLPPVSAEQRQALLARAERVEAKGNLVRAALCRAQAGDTLACVQTVQRLVERLRQAIGFSTEEAADWQLGLMALLTPAASSVWPVEARLLVDLQNLCIDREQTVYAADLVEWIVSWGRKPIKRLLPYQGDVLAVKHLRSALGRLASARLDDLARDLLTPRLQHALHHAEEHVRERLRPVILRTLDKVDMVPTNAAETVARNKLVEELLDRIVEHGYLNMSDLRDVIARNRLKMPNLSSPYEFFHGDRLIRANRRLSESLDGVYHRGEIYLRWLQRLSSVAFGTAIGRFLTRYFVLPLGIAFVILEAGQHLLHSVLRWCGVIRFNDRYLMTLGGAIGPSAVAVQGPRLDYVTPYTVGLLGGLILGLFYVAPFRRAVLQVLRYAYYGGYALLFHLPWMLFQVPFIRVFLESRLWLRFFQLVVKPLFYSVMICLLYALGLFVAAMLWVFLHAIVPGIHRAFPPTFPLFTFLLVTVIPYLWAASFLVTAVLVNLPIGAQLEEIATDELVRAWHLVSADLFPGLFRWIVYLSKRFLEGVERLIYTVDEWLRFRQGDNAGTFYIKVILGLAWFCITYVVRFSVNLLIEPQINPIKHFPVVTVSHKLVLTMLVPPMAQALAAALGMEFAAALTVATVIGFCIPGIFGFLVWELKENWKLYRANQSPELEAEMVGSHGETVLRLLRPGFHSGTLPKLYAKLRRAKGRSLRKHKEMLHHVAESMRHFIERTLLGTLAGSRRWGLNGAVRVSALHCGCNRIRLVLACSRLEGETLLLDLEEHAGWLIAGFARRGWLAALTTEQTEAFHTALSGFYKLAGVDVVREQVAALLPPETLFTVTDAGLTVWLGDAEVCYDLGEQETLQPTVVRGSPSSPPSLARKDVVFGETELRWSAWVETWERDRADTGNERLPVERVEDRMLLAK